MFITKLDIVNACLKTMGETKLNTLEEDHVYKDDAVDQIERVTRDVSSLGLWFNTEFVELKPQATSKYIMVPTDALKLDVAPDRRGRIAQRGRRLYDVRRNSYEFDSSVHAKLVRLLDFDDLPYEVQMFVRDDSVLRFQSDFDGDNTKYQKIAQQRNDSWINLKSEHIRQIKANPLYARASVDVLRSRYWNYSGHPWHPHVTFPG
ncbi:tail protein [Xanthomonas phage XAJ24]|uniref:Tail tubular protein A n=1 Tax=Xanthomonas phage XAJ24 TaxID=1775250 RepID=A0A1I9L2B0_9CAUD|nr:tail protein [Xanthomonas phage XAJ24]AMW36097.1 tail tubular protein A [Xanthomonas phage XAJ24]